MKRHLLIGLVATVCSIGSSFADDVSEKILFILSGQSNMQAIRPKDDFQPRVEKEFGADKVMVVHEAIGGRPIRMWVHDWAPAADWKVDPKIPNTKQPNKADNGIIYKDMMKEVLEETQGKMPKAIAFCWMQGERDARERHSAVYERSLKTIFKQLEADFPNVPIVYSIGRLSDFGKDNNQKFYPEWEEVIAAQTKVAADTPYAAIVDTDDLNTGKSRPSWKDKKVRDYVDDLHMTQEGYKILGTRFAESSIKLLAERGFKGTLGSENTSDSTVSTSKEAFNDGTAPEVTDLNAADVSYAKEQKMPYLKTPFVKTAPGDRKDGIQVGSVDGKVADTLLAYAKEIQAGDHGNVDSLLIAQGGKLLFESYYRRGRINYPHYQMSITKSYTAMAIGRAIQLGHLKMSDLKKPVIDLIKGLDKSKLAQGAETITLEQAMNMMSGIRVDKNKARQLVQKQPNKLKGVGQIQTYLELTTPIPSMPRDFKYQSADTSITMQVLEDAVPGSAQDFIKAEVLGKLGIRNYGWQDDVSGLPKAAAGSSMRSRDMLKWGLLVMNDGKWKGEQLIPADYVKLATSPITKTYADNSYGFFWWSNPAKVGGKEYHMMTGRGAGGQFIMMIPELDLITVITAHTKGMGKMLKTAPAKIVPLFQN